MILGVDVGGTFTDAVAIGPDRIRTGKSPTTPDDQSRGAMAAVEQALGGAAPASVHRLVHGMTVGTNALLEGRTARTALIATEGFVDIEELGRQARPDLYRLCHAGPTPLVPPELRVAAPERCGPDGVLRPLDEKELRRRLDELAGAGVEAVAVCLLWGFRHPGNERTAGHAAAEALEGVHVSTSHETAAVFREHERCVTTVVDAAVSPLLRHYLERFTAATRATGLPDPEVMLSSGAVVDARTAAGHGAWTVLSGPAGGAVAAAAVARAAGVGSAVALDMGGTSCDVSVALDGEVSLTGGREIAGRALALPMVDIHTVGAGGGSIAWRDEGGALRVGPRSAGADPGPACYGHGGSEPTVTDASLLLGQLDESSPLPGVALDRAAAERAVSALADELGLGIEETAAGILRVACVEMAQAVRVMTVERGIDPRGLALVAFGGAGPLHAAAIADELGMSRVLAPLASGVLSALGLAVSERRRDVVESVLLSGAELTAEMVSKAVERLGRRGREELGEPEAELRATYELRYVGQSFELPIEADTAPDPAVLRERFDRAHAERYGYDDPEADLELVTIRVAAAVPCPEAPAQEIGEPRPLGRRRVRFGDTWEDAAVVAAGASRLSGAAIVELPGSTLVVPPGWSARIEAQGVVMERERA